MQKLRLSLKQDLADRLRLLGGGGGRKEQRPFYMLGVTLPAQHVLSVHLCVKFTFACPHKVSLLNAPYNQFGHESEKTFHFSSLSMRPFHYSVCVAVIQIFPFFIKRERIRCWPHLIPGWLFRIAVRNYESHGGGLRTNSHSILIPFCVVDLLPAHEV